MLGGLLALAIMGTLLFAGPTAALPPGPIPVIHVDSWYCTGFPTSELRSISTTPRFSTSSYHVLGNVR